MLRIPLLCSQFVRRPLPAFPALDPPFSKTPLNHDNCLFASATPSLFRLVAAGNVYCKNNQNAVWLIQILPVTTSLAAVNTKTAQKALIPARPAHSRSPRSCLDTLTHVFRAASASHSHLVYLRSTLEHPAASVNPTGSCLKSS